MIHNAIQVFYTKPHKNGQTFFGFPDIRFFFMSAFLSLKCLKDKGYQVKLITDNLGKKYLVDTFGLKYNDVSTELENLDINPHLWGLAKMYAFTKQDQPFLYCDLDAFLFNDISFELHKSPLFVQNHEENYYTAYDTYTRYSKHFTKKTDAIKSYEEQLEFDDVYSYGNAYNTAVFGGNDLEIIKNCCSEIIRYASQNSFKKIDNKEEGDYVSVFMEQVYFYYMIQNRYSLCKPLLHVNTVVDERLNYYAQWRTDYVHLASTQKFNFALLDKLIRELDHTTYREMEIDSWGLNYSGLLNLTRFMQ